MKKILFIIIIIFFTGNTIFAQTQGIKYQAVVRNASGAVLQNQTIGMRISILEGSVTGTSVYTETWNTQTNDFGLVNLTIGVGEGSTTDDFSAIDWGSNNYWMKIEMDEAGGSNYTEMGTSQLLSVPYALYSEKTPWTSSGDTLFCVKDAQKRPVFIVFSDGVQVIVDTTATKSGAGGRFLVSGRGLNKKDKGNEMNFMDMTKKNYLIGNNVAPDLVPTPTTGIKNSILGYEAGNKLTTGYEHTFIGYQAGYSSVGGNSNIFIGNKAGYSSQNGVGNINIGFSAGYSNNNNPGSNIFVGQASGYANANGFENVYIGYRAGQAGLIGENNVYLGAYAGRMNSGTGNVFIGSNVGNTYPSNSTVSNMLYIDNSSTATPLISGNFDDGNEEVHINGHFTFNQGVNSVTLPAGRGTSGQVLTTDGNGNTSWGANKSAENPKKTELLESEIQNQKLQIEKLLKENKNLEARLTVLEKVINKK